MSDITSQIILTRNKDNAKFVCNISAESCRLIYVTLRIENIITIPFILDCGSTISLISYSVIKKIIKIKNRIRTSNTVIDIILANGSTLETIGWVILRIRIKNLSFTEKFIVTTSSINLLGLTFFQDKRIKVEYHKNNPVVFINNSKVMGRSHNINHRLNIIPNEEDVKEMIIHEDETEFMFNDVDCYLNPDVQDNSKLDSFDIDPAYENLRQLVVKMLSKHKKLLDGKIGKINVIEPIEMKLKKDAPDGHISQCRRRSIPEKIVISAQRKKSY